MDKARLQALLDAETKIWGAKAFDQLVHDLSDVVAYGRGEGQEFHQFEVQILEHEDSYLHILISIDDGGLLRSFSPLSRGFFAHKDGRVEL